jgi:hypothetical protein
MKPQNYTVSITADQTPEQAFAAIMDVHGWWTGNPGVNGSTDNVEISIVVQV